MGGLNKNDLCLNVKSFSRFSFIHITFDVNAQDLGWKTFL